MFETYQIKNFRCENSWFLPSKSRFTMESTVLVKWGKSLEGIRVTTQIDTLIPTNQIQNVSKQNCHGTRPIGVQKRKIQKSRGTGLWRILNFRDYSEWKSICTTKLNWFQIWSISVYHIDVNHDFPSGTQSCTDIDHNPNLPKVGVLYTGFGESTNGRFEIWSPAVLDWVPDGKSWLTSMW